MKKSLLALAVLGAFAGAASAQSSVTLYGLIDLSLASEKENSADALKKMNSGAVNGSRWGLRGVEDLGGGMSANFVLESGFSADTGAGSADGLFNRTSTVGLAGGFGAVTLGRSLTLYDDVRGSFIMEHDDFDPSNRVQKEGGADYVGRFSNRIRYVTPAMGGFVAGAEVSGEGGYKSYAGKLGYAAGPINVQLGLQSDKSAAAPHDAVNHLSLLANYNLGFATLSAMYTAEKNKVTAADDDAKEWALGAKIPLGAAASVNLAYARSKVDGADNTATGFGIEARYQLSARTRLYAGFRSNRDDAEDAGGSQLKDRLLAVGVQHRF